MAERPQMVPPPKPTPPKCFISVSVTFTKKLPGLNLDVTASNFGKADSQSRPEDVAAGIVHMVIENICQTGILASANTGIKEYILIGGLTKFFECRQIIEAFKNLWDVEITIPEYSDYATAIGAVIADNEAQKIE